MHHVAVTLNNHVVGHLHTSRFGNSANIIASQIHQHHMLGFLLLITEELIRQHSIFLLGGTTRPRARNRTDLNTTAGQAHHDLWRRPHERLASQLQKEGIRRGIQEPQRTIKLHRWNIRLSREPLA